MPDKPLDILKHQGRCERRSSYGEGKEGGDQSTIGFNDRNKTLAHKTEDAKTLKKMCPHEKPESPWRSIGS
jgi:hypothetical protein